MELLIVPVPLFDKDMAVQSYCLKYKCLNEISEDTTTAKDSSKVSAPLEALNTYGIDAFSVDQPVFVPMDANSLLGNLKSQCTQPPDKVVFLFGSDVSFEDKYLFAMRELKEGGFSLAFSDVNALKASEPLLTVADYVFIDTKKLTANQIGELSIGLSRSYPNVRVIAGNIDDADSFEKIKETGADLFEGRFYRVPVTRGRTQVTPLKANLIRLINIVRDQNFEFSVVSSIVRRDTALSLSLLRMVNSPFLGLRQKVKSIQHAVVILGQDEIRKWFATSVSRSLGSDKPNEITKLSLVRAKFAENLAGLFGLKNESQSLFLMGLFSVLDIILDMDMRSALNLVQVSDDISGALIRREGRFAPVLLFMEAYEMADWPFVCFELIVSDIDVGDVNRAYIDAISWYSDLILEEIDPGRNIKADDAEEDV